MPIYYEAKALERAIDAAPRITPSTKSVLKKIIRSAPVADAEPLTHGRWLTWEEKFPDKSSRKKNGLGVFCAICGNHADSQFDYCPNCGARMDLEESKDE